MFLKMFSFRNPLVFLNFALAVAVLIQGYDLAAQENMQEAIQEVIDEKDKPASRPKYDIELNKESSSFVPDPDSLDPLPLKKESLKEDEEPALDNIKSILKKPAKTQIKKSSEVKTQKKPRKAARKKKSIPQINDSASSVDFANLSPDDPDYNLEQKFNDIYKKYNINPTPDSVWGAVSTKAANIYVVQKGDTLFSISRTLFGDPQFWPKIWALNNSGILNPHSISPGTQIYFYPGDGGQAPGLSVGAEAALLANNNSSDDESSTRDIGLKQNTEFNKLVKEGNRKITEVQDIPPSFPALGNLRFSDKPKTAEFVINPVPEISDREPYNPFILTGAPVKTAFQVPKKNAGALVCKENQYVPAVTQIDAKAVPGRYTMLVAETFNFGLLKKTHVYRIIGEADVSGDESLRISKCINPVDTDLLLVTAEELEAVKPPSEIIKDTRSQIIEGLGVYAQQYYYAHQYVILNMSQLPALEGADLKVFSPSVGGVVGEIRILKRTGTMAIGYVTKNNDVVQIGDRVVIPE